MIRSFADKRTLLVFVDSPAKGVPPDLVKRARAKLLLIHDAQSLEELRSPPANRLEALKGNRAGQHSIRVNDQWRICFRWDGKEAWDVEFCDYH